MTLVLGLGLAAVIGGVLGLLGGGGSVLTVPVFVYVLGYDARLAIALSLPVVAGAAVVGAVSHWRAGNVDARGALPFAGATVLGTLAGARLSVEVPERVLLLLFGAVVVVAALIMLAGGRKPREAGRSGPRRAAVLASGAGAGLLIGLIGVGGGFLLVPALVGVAGLDVKKAVGTSLLVIAVNAAVGAGAHAVHVALPWGVAAGFALAAMTGVVAGARAMRVVPSPVLRRGFAAFLLLVGGGMLYQTAHAAPPDASVEDGVRSRTEVRR